jgi:ArsR family transcriptional regulator
MLNWLKIFSALSDETRLRIFLLLLRKELCVCELVSILKMKQSRISHSLKELLNANLISVRREGQWRTYFVNYEILKKNFFVKLKEEIKTYNEDLKSLSYCKRENLRKKCKSVE